jgi:ribosomal protein S6
VVAEFSADPDALRELDRVLSLADDVLRFKVTVRAA